jgi:hypothetical protein
LLSSFGIFGLVCSEVDSAYLIEVSFISSLMIFSVYSFCGKEEDWVGSSVFTKDVELDIISDVDAEDDEISVWVLNSVCFNS